MILDRLFAITGFGGRPARGQRSRVTDPGFFFQCCQSLKYSTEHQADFASVVIFADGEPFLLDVSGWTQAAIGVSEPVYAKPVASSADAYYRVTADQIRLIAQASELRLRTTGVSPRDFELWDKQRLARQGLQAFIADQ